MQDSQQPPPTSPSALARALAALTVTNDDEEALRQLMTAWRFERLPEIAELIDLLSARITKKRAPIVARTVATRMQEWTAIHALKDPCDVGRLLETEWPANMQDAGEMLDQICTWPDDPRVAMALARIVEEMPYEHAAHFYRTLLVKIEVIADLRVIEVLGKSRRVLRDSKGVERVAATVSSLREIRRHLPRNPQVLSSLRECFSQEIIKAERKARGTKELLEAIYGNLDDDDVRQVYADFLSEHDDLRGEMITLQLARSRGVATEIMLRRERALLAKDERAWASSLHGYCDVEGRVYERGFLAQASLLPRVFADPGTVFADPAWTTVRKIDIRQLLNDSMAILDSLSPLFRTPFFQQVHAIYGLYESTATALARETNPDSEFGLLKRLKEIGIVLRYPAIDRPVLALESSFPALRRLVLELERADHDASWLIGSALWNRLEHLSVGPTSDAFTPWIAPARKTLSLKSVDIRGEWLAEFRDHAPSGDRLASVRLHYNSSTPHSLRAATDLGAILRALTRLGGVRELVVEPTRSLRPSVAERAAFESDLAKIDNVIVPFERPTLGAQPAPTKMEPQLAITLRGAWLGPRINEVVEMTSASNLTPPFDTFTVNSGIARPLGKAPQERLATWAQKPTTQRIALYRDGVRAISELTLSAPGSSALPIDNGYYLTLPGSTLTFICLIPDAGDRASEQAFSKAVLEWLCPLLERFEIHWGSALFNQNVVMVDVLKKLASTDQLGFITIFGRHHEALFPREELIKLPALLGPAIGASVHVTSRNVILMSAPSPLTPVDPGRTARWNEVFSPLFRAGFLRRYGWDPYAHIAHALETMMTAHGFARVTADIAEDAVGFRREIRGFTHAIYIDLLNAIHYPLIAIRFRIDRGSSARTLGDDRWKSTFNLLPKNPHGAWPAGTRDEVDQSMTQMQSRIESEAEAWFAAEEKRLPPS